MFQFLFELFFHSFRPLLVFGDYDGDEDGKNSSPSKTVSFLRGGGGGVFTTSVVSSKLAFDRHRFRATRRVTHFPQKDTTFLHFIQTNQRHETHAIPPPRRRERQRNASQKHTRWWKVIIRLEIPRRVRTVQKNRRGCHSVRFSFA
jgi:hypothetical protein